MLIFLKSVSLSEEDYITLFPGKHVIHIDVNNLRTAFLSIQEDFRNMEKQFDYKFDILLRYYSETLNHIYVQQFEKEEEQELENRNHSSLYDVLEPYFIEKIFPKIVFQDFLEFYDEYSYAINERIVKIYGKEYLRVKSEARNIYNFKEIYVGESQDFRRAKYLGLQYFINKLEIKLSYRFNIHVSKIRRILYGCYLQDEVLQMTYKQVFYDIILRYKNYGGTRHIGYVVDEWELTRELQIYKQTIKDNLCMVKNYLFRGFSCLYEYHRNVSQSFMLSKTRFIIYDQLLKKYGQECDFSTAIREGGTDLFETYAIYTQDTLQLGLCRQVFKLICYNDNNTIYIYWFDQIKAILVPNDSLQVK